MRMVPLSLVLNFAIQCLLHLHTRGQPISTSTVTAFYDFSDGFQGWARSNVEEMGVEVSMSPSGEIQGTIVGPKAHVDSPLLLVDIEDREYFVIRLLYVGICDKATVIFQTGVEIPDRLKPFSDSDLSIEFAINSDGMYHIYYMPIHRTFQGKITRIRILLDNKDPGGFLQFGNTFGIDWIMIAKAPTITKVRGCIDVYYEDRNFDTAISNVSSIVHQNNDFHHTFSTKYGSLDLPYATTYNCLRWGGERIKISGKNFGLNDAVVEIDGKPCLGIVHTVPETEIECVLPPGTKQNASVVLKNGIYQGLIEDVAYLSYAAKAPQPQTPKISNIAARAVDVNWLSPASYWHALSITGYQIRWRMISETGYNHVVNVGNVTKTTIINLSEDTQYEFKIAAVVEDQVFSEEWKENDLYGRRELVQGAIVSDFSQPSEVVRTLKHDFLFKSFDANSTLNYSALDARSTLGPSGEIGGQGHYGLYVVGDTNIQNCNTSHVCCDGFQSDGGGCSMVCSAIGTKTAEYTDKQTSRPVRTNAPIAADLYRVAFGKPEAFSHRSTAACGPALRLTGSHSLLSGAAWYPRRMNVREGFDTTFSFRISNPSTQCMLMDDVHTRCRSRGGDGFAFVIQNLEETAVGIKGYELSYGGLRNSIAVEFDTWYNYELLDPYENHVSVHTRGWRFANSANHSFSLGSTPRVPDMTDGAHTVRITYSPAFDEESIFHDSFVASSHVSHFLSNADFENGGQADWGIGIGTLKVYMDDLLTPVLVIPLSIESTLDLYHGRAWVGFTASTGQKAWQAQDILTWEFTSLRIDPPKSPPPLTNGEGSYECKEKSVCVHW